LISLARKYDDAAARLQRLEALPPPQSSPQLPPRPPPTWINPFDSNPAPGDGTCPSASSSEQPSGRHQQSGNRDLGGGILGSFPPHPVTGMSQQPPPISLIRPATCTTVWGNRVRHLRCPFPVLMARILDCGRIGVSCILRSIVCMMP
jgi:hypothetical protein